MSTETTAQSKTTSKSASNAMFTKRVQKWKEKLLDLSRRNRMLNFRPRKVSSLQIEESFTTFSQKLIIDEKPLLFELNQEDEFFDEDETLAQLEQTRNRTKILKNIMKRMRLAEEEYGYNIGYIAYGFLEWTESESSEIPLRSPLILIPVTVEQADRFSDFVVRFKHGEDVEVNPTLLEKLRSDFGINLAELGDLDFSDTQDFNTVLRKLEEQIQVMPNWRIVKEIWLDTFDFQNMVILNDIKLNGKLIQENLFADSLAESKPIELEHAQNIDLDSVQAKDKIQILDADSSQEEALYRANKGESFVIQGPPGTGKSQTITNIIAEALYHGKNILFVSEKQAALDVVYEKLQRADLAVFCLKMHNSRQTKANIREQLQASMDLAEMKQQISPDEMQIYDRLDQAKLKLNTYDKSIHKIVEPLGRSVFWIFGQYEKVRSAPVLMSKIPLYDYAKTQNMFNDLRYYIDTLEHTAGDFFDNGWKNYRGQLTEAKITRAREKAEEILTKIAEYNDLAFALSTDRNPEKINRLEQLVDELKEIESFNWIESSWWELQNKDLRDLRNKITEIIKVAQKYNQNLANLVDCKATIKNLRRSLNEEATIKDRDLGKYREILTKFRNKYSGALRIFNKNYREDLAALNGITLTSKLNYSKALKLLNNIVSLDDELAKKTKLSKSLEKTHAKILGDLNQLQVSSCEKLQKTIDTQKSNKVAKDKFNVEVLQNINEEIAFYEKITDLIKPIELDAEVIEDLWDNVENATILRLGKDIKKLGQEIESAIDEYNDFALEATPQNRFEKISSWENFAKKIDWDAALQYEKYTAMRKSLLDKYELEEILDEIEKLKVPKEDIDAAIKKRLYTILLEKSEVRNQYVTDFERDIHDKVIMNFRKYDNQQRQLAAARIRCALIQRMPDFSGFMNGTYSNSDGEISTLKREVKKKSRLMPTRKLLEKIPIILPKLKPCIMMSPITVSSYFSSNPKMKFDLVIFDEASQVKTETAITAIMRAKQLIMAGDSKQMPPTNFFNASNDDDENESEDLQEVSGLESVLDELTVSLPEVYLKWHYRSRAESLIEFSNKRFYEKRLYTFPSVYTNNENLGLSFKYVANGIWENRGGNKPEAEAVAQLVLNHIRKHRNKSLGIVAFGKSQATAIEDAVLKVRDSFPQYEDFFSENKDEPFFIKNLENVQGDERDAIILSVGYGKGPDGKFAMRFGPLSVSGGERRLNVAISRAKEQMIVVSSFHANEIRDEEKNENRKLLKEFLDFAEHGKLEMVVGDELDHDEVASFDSPFEEAVYDFLISKGHTVKTQIGVSGYKIDMAIVDPKDSGRYILAIECDGASYHSSRTARDRDRLRQNVLEGMGWNFHRIWSTDWFYNQDHEKEKLLEAVELAASGKPLKSKEKLSRKISVKTVDYDVDEKVRDQITKLRKKNLLKLRFNGNTVSCSDQQLWNKVFEIALQSGFEGKTRDEFARYVAGAFLWREKLTASLKVYTNRAIDTLIEEKKIKEVGGSLARGDKLK